MSQTPRTDAERARIESQLDGEPDSVKYVLDQMGGHAAALERELTVAQTTMAQLSRENDYMRTVIGTSDNACLYCGLAAEAQAFCPSGFPGCARADDQLLCGNVGVGYERDILKAENARLRAALAPFAALRLYPDDVGEDLAAMIRIDDNWNEQENEATRDEVLVRRRDVRTARIALNGGETDETI